MSAETDRTDVVVGAGSGMGRAVAAALVALIPAAPGRP